MSHRFACRASPSGLPASRISILILMVAIAAFSPLKAAAGDGSRPSHDLAVRLEPSTRELWAEDIVTNPPGEPLVFGLHRNLQLERVLLDGAPVTAGRESQVGDLVRWRVPVAQGGAARRVTIAYRGTLPPLQDADHREVLGRLPPMADPRGSFLPAGSGWYPDFGEMPFAFYVRLDLSADQRGLVPGHLVGEEVQSGRYRAIFAFPSAPEGIALIVGPYLVHEQQMPRNQGEPLRIRTYFHREIADLAADYLTAAEGYLKLYSSWIGPYPYGEFSIVSSPLPTGFGMPTLTYLGVDVLRLPFIRATSLGHEVLHNWWGNGVYVDWERGNWSEALTTFMADYTYKEQEGADGARELRLSWLRDFAAVPAGRDTPLRQFTARTHGTSQVIGYDKGAFLFLMLRDWIGAKAFDAGVRRFWNDHRFRQASWADLAQAFEQSAGQDLPGFFDQWLSRRGAPRVSIESARVGRTSAGYRVQLWLSQDLPTYVLRVPIRVTTETGREDHSLTLSGKRQEHAFVVRSRPRSLTVDPDFRLFRRLDPGELPPILRQVMLDPATVTILPGADALTGPVAEGLAHRLLDHPPVLGSSDSLPSEVPLLVIGLHAAVDAFVSRTGLPQRPAAVLGKGTAQVWTSYRGNDRPIAVVSGENPEALRDLLRPLPHYGRQSYLVFDGARLVEQGVWPGQPTEWRFDEDRPPRVGGQ